MDELSLLGVHFDDTEHGWVVANVGRRNRLLATSDGGRRWNTEITLSSGVSGRVEEWVFCTAGERLFASNGMVLLSREMPEVHD